MIFSPELQTLSLDDLNQRYAETFVQYGGKIRRIHAFTGDKLAFIDGVTGNVEEFLWDRLDITRPAPRFVDVDGVIWWCYYMYAKKQYKRGFAFRTNFHIVDVTKRLSMGNNRLLQRILDKWYNYDEVAPVVDDYSKNAIITPVIAYIDRRVYYRSTRIAEMVENTLNVFAPAFVTELEQHFKGVSFNYGG